VTLLDGPHTITLYPEADTTDDDGNPVRAADLNNPTTVVGRLVPAGTSEDDTDGQAVTTSYRFLCRSFPAGAWARVEAFGREWDVSGEPVRRAGSPATVHVTVLLRARGPEAVP
jgi:hypothetical protein